MYKAVLWLLSNALNNIGQMICLRKLVFGDTTVFILIFPLDLVVEIKRSINGQKIKTELIVNKCYVDRSCHDQYEILKSVSPKCTKRSMQVLIPTAMFVVINTINMISGV